MSIRRSNIFQHGRVKFVVEEEPKITFSDKTMFLVVDLKGKDWVLAGKKYIGRDEREVALDLIDMAINDFKLPENEMLWDLLKNDLDAIREDFCSQGVHHKLCKIELS